VTEEELLEKFGVTPDSSYLNEIRGILSAEVEREEQDQGAGDTELMRLCCVQLFSAGNPADALLIWKAKSASMDAAASIEIQLLCGAGLTETKAYLRSEGSELATQVLNELDASEKQGDFKEFFAGSQIDSYRDYYLE
jgi:hypothetical protein